jgi:hypothetical protein
MDRGAGEFTSLEQLYVPVGNDAADGLRVKDRLVLVK